MGQFSWLTSDTNEQIPCDTCHPPVYMVDDNGNSWEELQYGGYGIFGGKDYYILLAEMNGLEPDRAVGIKLEFSDKPHKKPKFVYDESLTDSWDTLPNSACDPNQGWTREYC